MWSIYHSAWHLSALNKASFQSNGKWNLSFETACASGWDANSWDTVTASHRGKVTPFRVLLQSWLLQGLCLSLELLWVHELQHDQRQSDPCAQSFSLATMFSKLFDFQSVYLYGPLLLTASDDDISFTVVI